ncbi:MULTISPECIES: NADH:ubiquinone oxidoreductase [unclassified Ensifer]|uniref:NADH:ubiquinone oxidoreductase n=1 Tax=unclassified Ensifer TaxID=2633371 RepID=UPI000812E782|nr:MULTISPECIES: NADH:ubiquinone oxidoreductase [unclassified Ensifer]OCP01261.1 NADH:ubiquinone oxidoreductase [Ensifer sp. LC14]OCP03154.1 NADH:ubiquinone oxidoreductase [Ensifer sp. LC11]OCP03523.1 NADH:ubiquinone oxidoreductase [Ensifer sp. LC13]OCP33936.1 NADH:ubiquinone oxidoreductase [Ensifer sp. LC499]
MAGARGEGQMKGQAEAGIPFAGPLGSDPADPFGMAEWMKGLPQMPLHPLMVHPAAAVAAATAIGFGLTSHFAGAMLGAMQGAVEAAQKRAEPVVPDATTAVVAEAVQAEAKPEPVARPSASAKRAVAKPVVEKVAAEKVVKARATRVKAKAADDLKRISGIGPKLEQVLNAKGVRGFADIAGWSEADVARFDEELGFGGRISRDDWVGQAKALKGA